MVTKEFEEYKAQIDNNPLAFRKFPVEARDDRELVKYALDANSFNMWYLSDRLKNDKDYAKDFLSQYPTFHMNKLGEKLQKDEEMVLFAIKRNATFDLRDLEQVCKYFIDNKMVMEHAMEKLQENPMITPGEITMGEAMVASLEGKQASLELVDKKPEAYRLLSEQMKRDADIALMAIDGAPYLINEIPKELQNAQFYEKAVAKIPAARAEMDIEAVREMEKPQEKPKKSFDEVMKWVKQEQAKRSSDHSHHENGGRDSR